MITVIGPNPAIDYTLDVPHFTPGGVSRSVASLQMAGGKPLNVARTIRRLGGSATLVLPLGGAHESGLIESACQELGIRVRTLAISGHTRTCVIIVDPEHGATVVNEPGPRLSAEEAAAYSALAVASLAPASLALSSGSLPPGLPPGEVAHWVRAARERCVPLIIDTSGAPLRAALTAVPWAVKVNETELLEVTGAGDVGTAARDLAARGVHHVVVTLGAHGALYTGPEGSFRIGPAPVATVNPIASGDAFLGALAVGLQRGDSWLDALRLASAVAGFSASRFEPGIGSNPLIDSLVVHIDVSPD